MEFNIEISLKPDKSENYSLSYQWDTCLSLLAKGNVLVGCDPSFVLQTDLEFHHVKSVEHCFPV